MTNNLISRQAAIDAICEDGTRLERQGQYSMTMAERKQRDADILEALLSVQPERKTGKWLREIGAYLGGYPRFRYHCSVCGNVEEHVYADSKCANFCPNCGADMREVSE